MNKMKRNLQHFYVFAGWIMMIILPALCGAQSLTDTLDKSLDTLPPMAKDYQWLSYRGKADIIDTGGTHTCNFYMVNRIDSIIYLNVHASGIELMRFVFTPDSVTYVNKLTYQYYKGGYAPFAMLTRLPVNFKMIQAMFNGQEELLPQHQKYSFTYSDYAAVDSLQSFFTRMNFKALDQVIEIDATIKVVRFNVPGPTSIRIPEKFKALPYSE